MEHVSVLEHSPSIDEIERLRALLTTSPTPDEVLHAVARLRSIERAAVNAQSELTALYLDAIGNEIDDELPAELIDPHDVIA